MATAIASRFAVLPDDVDDDYSKTRRRLLPKTSDPSKSAGAATNKPDSKKKKNKENTQVTNGKAKKKVTQATTGKKKKEATSEQWEEWKEKDSQMVDGTYENQLTEAIMLSKIDYEEKKDIYEQTAKVSEPDKKPGKKNKKTIRILSVEEFHQLGKPTKPKEAPPIAQDRSALKEDPVFVSKIKEDVKKQLSRENHVGKVVPVVREFNEEALTVAQLRDSLDKKVSAISELQSENDRLKQELLNVKTRNKQLCQILANGEMKDKAEVLMEVERLVGVRDELSQEIDNLHVQLEQERSKVRALMADKTKDKNKKRTTSSGET